jgi:prevent-host-death family protein
MIDQVGIRDLKQNASAIVKRAASGEAIEITDRGRPVARIIPLRQDSVYDRLLQEGRITRPRGHLLDHHTLPPVPGRPTGSEALAQLRQDER